MILGAILFHSRSKLEKFYVKSVIAQRFLICSSDTVVVDTRNSDADKEKQFDSFSTIYEKMGPTDKISRQNIIRAASLFQWTHIQTTLGLQSFLANAVTLPQVTNETSAISFHLPDQPCEMLETFSKSIIAQRFLSATKTDLRLQDGVWRWFQGLWPTGRSDRSRNFKYSIFGTC